MEGHVSTQGIGVSSEPLSSGFVTNAQFQEMVVFDRGVEHHTTLRVVVNTSRVG